MKYTYRDKVTNQKYQSLECKLNFQLSDFLRKEKQYKKEEIYKIDGLRKKF